MGNAAALGTVFRTLAAAVNRKLRVDRSGEALETANRTTEPVHTPIHTFAPFFNPSAFADVATRSR